MHISCFPNLHTCYDLTRFPKVVCFEYQLYIADSKKMCISEMDGKNKQGRERIIIHKLYEGRDLVCVHGFISTQNSA